MTAPQIPPKEAPLSLVRLKDPNEALGLAARLFAGDAPFRDLPLGGTIGMMMLAIDLGSYVFVRRGDRAVGVGTWLCALPEAAERWLGGQQLKPSEILAEGPVAVIPAIQAVDTRTTRFLMNGLRDGPMRRVEVAYYLRDYGKGSGRHPRLVRLVRPRARRG